MDLQGHKETGQTLAQEHRTLRSKEQNFCLATVQSRPGSVHKKVRRGGREDRKKPNIPLWDTQEKPVIQKKGSGQSEGHERVWTPRPWSSPNAPSHCSAGDTFLPHTSVLCLLVPGTSPQAPPSSVLPSAVCAGSLGQHFVCFYSSSHIQDHHK